MNHQVISSLIRINHQRLRAQRSALAPYHYQGVMHLILLYLYHHPGASQDEIACFYALDKSGVARDARRLEEMGHICRQTNPDNRRQYRLYLTQSGSEFVKILDGIRDDFSQKILRGLSEEERELLIRLLMRLEANCCEDI